MKFSMKKTLLLLCASLFLLTACTESDPVIKDIRKQGKLIVLTRNAPSTYYLNAEGAPAGFEYDLSKALADSLNVEVEYKVYENIEEIISAVNLGAGHIAAAGLTRTDNRNLSQVFGPGYKTIQQQVVCHRKSDIPKNAAELVGKTVLVISESSYLESLNREKVNFPELKWGETSELSTEQVLEQVENRVVDCTVVDSNIMSLNRRYYPNLMVAFALSAEQELAWLLPGGSQYFKKYVEDWFVQIEKNSVLSIIKERYYGYVDIFDYYNNYVFIERIGKRLPRYQKSFQKEAEKYNLSWTLLAAQSYQESGWNAKAKSHTGVRGLMMLTQNTAKAMGVKTRTDPVQSIQGGAKYLDKMLKKIPEDVAEKDKVWFALAAYNVGFAHLLDARALARQLGKSPSTWHDMKEVLPLLSQKQYYKNLKYGYARGAEPVKYIDRIRYYRDVLINSLRRAEVERL